MAKILIVDDDASMRLMLNRILKSGGHELVEAANGRESEGLLHAEAPDLVVMDMLMPEQDGIETIREIRRGGSTVGIIAISGGGRIGGDMYLEFSCAFGADEILHKPFRPAELLSCVDRVLALRS
jgi:DNA-binding response OmpR family regulator